MTPPCAPARAAMAHVFRPFVSPLFVNQWVTRLGNTLCLVAALTAGTAVAAGDDAGLMSLDTDNDHAVSRNEFVDALKQRFARMDKNGNGRLTVSELRSFAISQMLGSRKDPIFDPGKGRPDIPFDQHGEVDFAGFSNALVRFRFEPVDRNHDHALSAAEIDAESAR